MTADKPHVTSVGIYVAVFAALMVLTAITVWAAFLELGYLNDVVALAIAVSKATIVVLFFMHVKHSTPLIKFVVIGGFFWLALLLGLTWMDYVGQGFLS
ncbi:MAG: cytochrome C oxidase subunit IV family protein [Thermoanaerobaculia bacterium]